LTYKKRNLDGDETFRSILDLLVDAGVPEEEIVHEVNTMIFGGHETGAIAIHLFLFMMALHPEYQVITKNHANAKINHL